MIDLNTELETVMVATGVGVMLCMAVWLFFRQESDGVQSLFLKMIDPFDDEIGQRSSIPLLFPPVSSGPANNLLPPHGHGWEILNKSMRLTPLNQPKEGARKSLPVFSSEIHDGRVQAQATSLRPSGEHLGQNSVGKCSEQRSLGGILVVDDDPEILKFIRRTCGNSGYDVIEAENGAEAIKALTNSEESSRSIDIIITDISMPKITGLEAIAYFQREFPSIPLIVLTGIADLELAISFIGGGISNYLVKPLEEEQLKASVAGAIRHQQLTYA